MRHALGLVVAIYCCLAACADSPDQPAAKPPVQFQQLSADPVAHGRRLADVLGCTGCHGADLTGEDWSEPGFGRLWTANLTRSVAAYDDEQLIKIIQSGRRPDRDLWEMPSHLFTQLSDHDMKSLVAFLRSRPPTGDVRPGPVFEDGARREIAAGTFTSSHTQVRKEGNAWPPAAGEAHSFGRYIVRATCAECHQMNLRGGKPNPAATARPDLRMASAYDDEQFKRLLRTGIAAGEREVGMMSGVARGRFKHLSDDEIGAVHDYLRTVAEMDP